MARGSVVRNVERHLQRLGHGRALYMTTPLADIQWSLGQMPLTI